MTKTTQHKNDDKRHGEVLALNAFVIRFTKEPPRIPGYYFFRHYDHWKTPDRWAFVEVYERRGVFVARRSCGHRSDSQPVEKLILYGGAFSVNMFSV